MNEASEPMALDRIDDLDGDYSQSDLVDSLAQVGIGLGDIVYVIVNFAKLGKMRNCSSTEEHCQCLLKALQDTVGSSGTILVPSTYTFLILPEETFDVQTFAFYQRSPGVHLAEFLGILPPISGRSSRSERS